VFELFSRSAVRLGNAVPFSSNFRRNRALTYGFKYVRTLETS
jgi:hypothetical protein